MSGLARLTFEDIALPLYQGLMFYDRLPNVAQHIRGSGRRAEWTNDCEPIAPIQPQFLIAKKEYQANDRVTLHGTKIGIRSLSNATNERTVIAGVITDLPSGNSVNYFTPSSTQRKQPFFLVLSSLVFDWQARIRIAGTNMNFHFFAEMGLPLTNFSIAYQSSSCTALGLAVATQAATRLEWNATQLPITLSERTRCSAMADAIVASAFRLNSDDLAHVLVDCDLSNPAGHSTGFWRVDKEKDPELRRTVLTQIAFRDLEETIKDAGGNWELAVRQFLDQNEADGWILPETVRLTDYGLGDDERAKHPQPVTTRLGARFYDWQLAQSADESRRECHVHARNLLGEHGYAVLLDELIGGRTASTEDHGDLLTHDLDSVDYRRHGARLSAQNADRGLHVAESPTDYTVQYPAKGGQQKLFD